MFLIKYNYYLIQNLKYNVINYFLKIAFFQFIIKNIK